MGREADDLERIIGHTPVIVFHWRADPGWPVEYVSSNISRLGYSPEDFYSGRLTYAQFVHPDDLERVVREIEEHLTRGDEDFFQEYRVVTASGQTRWLEDRTAIRRDASDAIIGLEGVVLDVTERRLLELEDRRLQHFERVLLDALPMPVFFKDTSLIYRGCNKAFAAFVGVPREKVLGAGVELWAPDLAQTYDQKDRELLADPRGLQVYEAQVTYADGSRHEVIFHKTTYRGEDGALAGIVGVVVDITERNQALRQLQEARDQLEQRVEERTAELSRANRELSDQVAEREAAEHRLRESEQRFRELADALPQMVFETDLEGRLTWFNRIAYSMFGYRPEEVEEGLNAHEMVVPEDRERASNNIRGVFASQGPEQSEYTGLRRDGSRFSILVSSRPILHDGRPIGMRGVIVDISDRVAVERLKDEFLSIASHELRTPLTPLHLLIAQGLRRLQRGQPVEAATLEKMDKHARQLAELIGDLLDVSRLERGTMAVRPVPLDLRHTVGASFGDFRSQHPELAVSLELPAEPVPVVADPTRLEQVIANLLDNALKYGADSPIEARLTLEAGTARLTITDHGPGIPAEQQERLFTRFFRAASPGKPGLGLGLYICREIIERHGGTIGVQSEAGHGSTFAFTLPVLPEPDEDAPEQPAPEG